MKALSVELKEVIARRLSAAGPLEIAEIVGQICSQDEPLEFSFSATTPAALATRFTVVGETIEDATTGLVWTRAHVGERVNWKDAQNACAELNLGGFTDWRLPTIRELLSIVDYERWNPAIDPLFKCEASWHWTSTPRALSPGDCAWGVDFNNGYAFWGNQGCRGLVRAVRRTGERA